MSGAPSPPAASGWEAMTACCAGVDMAVLGGAGWGLGLELGRTGTCGMGGHGSGDWSEVDHEEVDTVQEYI